MKEELIEEIWESNSELIGSDISDLDYWSGKIVMTKQQFINAIKSLNNV